MKIRALDLLKGGKKLGRAVYKVKGGKLIKVQLTSEDKKIKSIKIMGDFFLHPEEVIDDIEQTLEGHLLDEQELSRLIREVLASKKAVSLGVSPEDFARCIMMAGEKNE
ncbi:TPA: lipoate--protein ligase family protein [Candidatus Bathyarchaeota archaeon]|nr:lipoate--protein ligase family protein [Candidatus Bathyarchaeota archaeon]